jgi:hypothetical protein
MLKKAVKQKQLALAAQTLRNLTASDLGRVNGGQVLRPAVESGQSVQLEACSSRTY